MLAIKDTSFFIATARDYSRFFYVDSLGQLWLMLLGIVDAGADMLIETFEIYRG